MGRLRTKKEDKRKALKAAGWRRQDFQSTERWFPPTPATDRSSCLGQSLQTAWNNYQRGDKHEGPQAH